MLLFEGINLTRNWYCYHQEYVRDYFLLKETDKKTNTTYFEMYFSIIPPFKESDRCYVGIYNHHNTLEANVFIRQYKEQTINVTDTFYDSNNVWNVRRQGNGEYQKALYAVSKLQWEKEQSGIEGKFSPVN